MRLTTQKQHSLPGVVSKKLDQFLQYTLSHLSVTLHKGPSVTRVNWNSCWNTRREKTTFKSVSRRYVKKDEAKMKTAGENLSFAGLARFPDNLHGDWMKPWGKCCEGYEDGAVL